METTKDKKSELSNLKREFKKLRSKILKLENEILNSKKIKANKNHKEKRREYLFKWEQQANYLLDNMSSYTEYSCNDLVTKMNNMSINIKTSKYYTLDSIKVQLLNKLVSTNKITKEKISGKYIFIKSV